MDVLVKISRYFGLWLLNPSYWIVSVLTETGEQVIIVHESRIEGKTTCWLEVANTKDNSIVRVEKAQSLLEGSVPVADEVVMKLSLEAMPEEITNVQPERTT